LIKNLLKTEPSQRYNIQQVMNHAWVKVSSNYFCLFLYFSIDFFCM